jgi:hypothetical protein
MILYYLYKYITVVAVGPVDKWISLQTSPLPILSLNRPLASGATSIHVDKLSSLSPQVNNERIKAGRQCITPQVMGIILRGY